MVQKSDKTDKIVYNTACVQWATHDLQLLSYTLSSIWKSLAVVEVT